MEIYPNRKLLLSETITIDSVFEDNNIVPATEMIFDANIIIESIDTPKNFSFNKDFLYEFVAIEERRFLEPKSVYASTNPITVMGPCVFVLYSSKVSKLMQLEFMFGDSLPINNYRRYIQPFNQRLAQITGNRELPVFPTRKPNSRKQIGYFRYWVFKERMTTLYYPNDSLPRYDCDIEEYYRSDDCGINLLLDKDKIVALDGWMKVPEELKHTSDMRLLISKKHDTN
jgi:hypothetical protein